MASDIKPYGSSDDVTWKWVIVWNGWTGSQLLELIVIHPFGEILHRTGRMKPMAPGAQTEEKAVTEVIAAGIAQADRDLERRGKDAPAPEATPEPMDPATERFFEDDGFPLDLSTT